jgi:hypothetical protein
VPYNPDISRRKINSVSGLFLKNDYFSPALSQGNIQMPRAEYINNPVYPISLLFFGYTGHLTIDPESMR